MKRIPMILVALALVMSTAAWAEDGTSLYKTKCAMCHGASAEGKMGPAIKGKDNAADVITKGGLKGPHAKPMAAVNAEQAKAISEYVASLK